MWCGNIFLKPLENCYKKNLYVMKEIDNSKPPIKYKISLFLCVFSVMKGFDALNGATLILIIL